MGMYVVHKNFVNYRGRANVPAIKTTTMSKLTNKTMFLGLLGNGVPTGEVKAKMFEFHNSYVGKSPYKLTQEQLTQRVVRRKDI